MNCPGCKVEMFYDGVNDSHSCGMCKFKIGNVLLSERIPSYQKYVKQFLQAGMPAYYGDTKYNITTVSDNYANVVDSKGNILGYYLEDLKYDWDEMLKWNPETGTYGPNTIYPIIEAVKNKLSEGTKYDSNKLMLELIPDEALVALASVLTYGATKYEAENWRKGIKYKRVLGAMMRHITAWKLGEINDPESGLPHLWHAIFGLAVLITYEAHPNYKEFNDLQQVPMDYKDLLNQAIEKAKEFKNGK